jgi:hypothetical protein
VSGVSLRTLAVVGRGAFAAPGEDDKNGCVRMCVCVGYLSGQYLTCNGREGKRKRTKKKKKKKYCSIGLLGEPCTGSE